MAGFAAVLVSFGAISGKSFAALAAMIPAVASGVIWVCYLLTRDLDSAERTLLHHWLSSVRADSAIER
jgi:hypothetical protein